MPNTFAGAIFTAESLSLASRPTEAKLLKPRPLTATTFLVVKSIVAIALFSCNVTYAYSLSLEMVMYSGSRSCATVAFGPNTRAPA